MPISASCSIASSDGNRDSIVMTVPPPSRSVSVTTNGHHGHLVVRRAAVVGEPVRELESARRLDRHDLPPAVVLLALGAGHEVGDPAARSEVVVDDGGGIRRRAPPALELPRVGPQLPRPLDRRVELGGDRSSSGPRVLVHGRDGHRFGPSVSVRRRGSRRSGRCGLSRRPPTLRAADRPCGSCRRCRGRAARGRCAA